jgi:ferric-dicitrate binding protein FerR (iron transport regulator)
MVPVSPMFDSSFKPNAEQVAAAWLARLDFGISPQEEVEFRRWLAADSLHGEWIERHRATLKRIRQSHFTAVPR